jgi:hypothetical protein
MRRLMLFAVLNVAVVTVVFLLFEGFSSALRVAYEIATTKPVAERRHTTYDPDLGWVNVPNVFIPDMYGPGRAVRINAQRIRGNEPVTTTVPPGKIRVICSGDSFTFGYGVDNDHTWCQQLVTLDPRLQPVNMGQGGYGVDQAYLWFKRDGASLDHDIHLFAFVAPDFVRMLHDRFLGYDKPVLDVRDGLVIVHNVPVPQSSPFRLWLNRQVPALSRLSSVRLLHRVFFSNVSTDARSKEDVGNWARQVVAGIIADLQRLNDAKHSALVLVLLPTRHDYLGNDADFWREFLREEVTQQGVAFVDMVEELRALPPQQVEQLFIPEGAIDYVGAAGHYSDAGNTWAAATLYRRLQALPQAAAKLGTEHPTGKDYNGLSGLHG